MPLLFLALFICVGASAQKPSLSPSFFTTWNYFGKIELDSDQLIYEVHDFENHSKTYSCDMKTMELTELASVEPIASAESNATNPAATEPIEVPTTELASLTEGRFKAWISEHDGVRSYFINDGTLNRALISDNDPRIPEGMTIAPLNNIFRSDSTKVFIGLKKRQSSIFPRTNSSDVKIWAWNDDYLMPELEKKHRFWDEKVYACRLDISGNGPLVILEEPDSPIVEIGRTNAQRYVFAGTDAPYRRLSQWQLETVADYYVIDLETGERKMVMQGATIKYDGVSPDGRYLCYLDCPSGQWHLYDILSGTDKNLTEGVEGIFVNDENDSPCYPFGYNWAKWSNDSKKVYIQEKFDVWEYDIASADFRPITDGAKQGLTYRWRTDIVSDEGFIDARKNLYFSVFDHQSKENGLAVLKRGRRRDKLQMLFKGPYSIGKVFEYGNSLIVQRGNFESGYDIYLIGNKGETQLTEINPQRKEYNWGTSSLLRWTTPDGDAAEGILYKPEDFDSTKKYPVIVYYYELNSDGLYSVQDQGLPYAKISFPQYVSNGYIVLVPDIRYKIGHPGESALKYVLSACDELCNNPWVDAEHIALQGQSWGGYQTAYIIAHTDRFAAACAGAPVVNMTSAYGGMRDTGKVRQYLYEQSQSRIGANLWDATELYIENSPIFNIPDIQTPVLIMHADGDGSVPFSQGVEFFTALKRCGKTAWLLQYLDESHDLTHRLSSSVDFSQRMSEFFGYYLKGEPMPEWMQ